MAHRRLRISRTVLRDAKRDRNDRIKFDHVADVVDKTLRLSRVDESDRWRVARGENGRFAYSVKTCSRCAHTPIGNVSTLPLGVIVVSTFPFNVVLTCEQAIHLSNTHALNSPKLINAAACRRRLLESKLVHSSNNVQPVILVESQLRLVQESIATRASGLASRVGPHTALPNPHKKCSAARRENHCGVTHSGPRLKKDRADTSDRNLNSRLIRLDGNECSVINIDATAFEKDVTDSIFLCEWFQRRQRGDLTHAGLIRTKPQPNPLAAPRPFFSNSANALGSDTVPTP